MSSDLIDYLILYLRLHCFSVEHILRSLLGVLFLSCTLFSDLFPFHFRLYDRQLVAGARREVEERHQLVKAARRDVEKRRQRESSDGR